MIKSVGLIDAESVTLTKDQSCPDKICFKNDTFDIELSISLEHFHHSDCSEIIRRHSNRLFLIREGEYPLSGDFEEESAKPESNMAVQMISNIQYAKDDVADDKKLRKHLSLKSPKSKGEQGFKSMKTTEFVLKEIMERKEQDISLDEEQNDGMKSPREEANSNIQEKASKGQKLSTLYKYHNMNKPLDLAKILQDDEKIDEKFDSFHSDQNLDSKKADSDLDADDFNDF